MSAQKRTPDEADKNARYNLHDHGQKAEGIFSGLVHSALKNGWPAQYPNVSSCIIRERKERSISM
jgi:hypothetical protein